AGSRGSSATTSGRSGQRRTVPFSSTDEPLNGLRSRLCNVRRLAAFVTLVAAFASGVLAGTGGCTTESSTSPGVGPEGGSDVGEQPDGKFDGAVDDSTS